MPVDAVTGFGAVTVNCGSTTASWGISTCPFRSILISRVVSLMIVNWVASDPVPAVVGIAVIGGVGIWISFPI